jgi:hypothetical protein
VMTCAPRRRVWQLGPMCTAALLIACTHTNVRAPTTHASRLDTAVARLPRTAYLVALDSSLLRVRGVSQQVWVDGAEPLPITAEDLKTRQAKWGNGEATCSGQASIKFGAPSQQPDGRILLHVIEAAAMPPGWIVGHVYFFRCDRATCRLEHDGQLEEDYLRTCGAGVEFEPLA